MKNICICGGGNLGHVVTGFLAAQENLKISLLTRRPDKWKRQYVLSLVGTLSKNIFKGNVTPQIELLQIDSLQKDMTDSDDLDMLFQ